MKNLFKFVIIDIDGVWIDGSMYYGNDLIELKRFNISDSVGVLFFCYLEILFVIMMGENV